MIFMIYFAVMFPFVLMRDFFVISRPFLHLVALYLCVLRLTQLHIYFCDCNIHTRKPMGTQHLTVVLFGCLLMRSRFFDGRFKSRSNILCHVCVVCFFVILILFPL